MEKNDTVQIRCSPELKAKLKARAEEQGITLTKLIWLSLIAANPDLAQDIMREI